MKIVKLTKLSDDKFGGKHPNGIHQGYVKKGILIQKPEIGKRCIINDFATSIVTEIINDSTFKTLYSTYQIENEGTGEFEFKGLNNK